jgi:hypothetical protein
MLDTHIRSLQIFLAMETKPHPNPPNPTDAIPRAIYYQVTHELLRSLPLPHTDNPEDAARRDFAAISHVAALLPATFEEAHVAVQYVAACAQSLDALRLARQDPTNIEVNLKCTAQSASMMRQARSWRASLFRTQAIRDQRDTDPVAHRTAANTERRTIGLMADALAAPTAQMPTAQTTPAHTATAQTPTAQQTPPATPQPTPLAEAERYALQHRKRASLIRTLGRLPDKLNIGALAPEVVHAIATGTSAILQALGPRNHPPTAKAA